MNRTRLVFAISVPLGALGLVSVAFGQHVESYPYESGQDIYEHVCQGCHMPGATGAQGAGSYPALASNLRLEAGLYPVLIILRGQKAMPAFPDLSDAQIAAVTNYVRASFGNNFPDRITPEEVKSLRPQAVEQGRGQPG